MYVHTMRSVTPPHLAVPLQLAPGAPPSKHETLSMYWFNVGPASQTLCLKELVH